MQKIVMDCQSSNCDCVLLIEYEGPRENDMEMFIQEISEAMSCPECKGSDFMIGWKTDD